MIITSILSRKIKKSIFGLYVLNLEKIKLIDEGSHTDVIRLGNSYLILQIDQIRINEVKIDKKKEVEKLIQAESNKQLNQFSKIYFDKSKINYSINEK